MDVRRIQLDRIASSTRNAKLDYNAVIGDEIPAIEGAIVAVRVITQKFQYDTIENYAGRMIKIRKGDIVAGVLGARQALQGYAGQVPSSVNVGDTLQILNLGGVIGKCTAINPDLGNPFNVEVLGSVLAFPKIGDRVGVPATISANDIQPAETLDNTPPIIYVAGTSMNSGKTLAATEIVRRLSHRGLRVAAVKLTGVSLMRDILSMGDAGADPVMDFTDAGVVSTNGNMILPIARGLINRLARETPDLIVAELGDGILGQYGVREILSDEQLMSVAACFVLCAPDPVAAFGAVQLFNNSFGLAVDVFTGPVTDNAVGRDFITSSLGIPAHNARSDIEGLSKIVLDAYSRKAALL